MPELAEVECFRKRWDIGLGEELLDVTSHGRTAAKESAAVLPGIGFERNRYRFVKSWPNERPGTKPPGQNRSIWRAAGENSPGKGK